jgi:hypothetical protein
MDPPELVQILQQVLRMETYTWNASIVLARCDRALLRCFFGGPQSPRPQITSNRYAPHLSNCMGLASARRGAIRGNPKSK